METDEDENLKEKFDFANKLSKKLTMIRKIIHEGIEKSDGSQLQKYIVVYLIDKLGIRVGHENDKGTFGCCTLLRTHVRCIKGSNKIHLKFIGKHQIEFSKEFEVLPKIYNYIRKTKGVKELFPDITPAHINRMLDKFMKGLTAKVFRTHHACSLFKKMLNRKPKNVSARKWYIHSNKVVAEYCNHTSNGTSKDNYLDPRITIEYCKKHEIPITSCYSEKQLKKFKLFLNN